MEEITIQLTWQRKDRTSCNQNIYCGGNGNHKCLIMVNFGKYSLKSTFLLFSLSYTMDTYKGTHTKASDFFVCYVLIQSFLRWKYH